MAIRKTGLRLKGNVDHRACGCRELMPRSSQLSSTTVYTFKECGGISYSMASIARMMVSSVRRASRKSWDRIIQWVDIFLFI